LVVRANTGRYRDNDYMTTCVTGTKARAASHTIHGCQSFGSLDAPVRFVRYVSKQLL
jgi:hypothetical protein